MTLRSLLARQRRRAGVRLGKRGFVLQDSIIPRQADLVSAATADAIMFMQVDQGQYRMLSGTARDIWELIDGNRSVADIVEALIAVYDVDRSMCEAQVKALLTDLHGYGMIEIAG